MSVSYYLRRLYSLDTLDTRFTTSSKTPQKQLSEARIDPARPSPKEELKARSSQPRLDGASPSKWGTPEFYVYYAVFLIVVPMMFWVPYDVSKASHPNYPKFEHLLSPGWILGRKVDNSDVQYSSFRNNVPYLLIVIAVHPLLRRLYNSIRPASSGSISSHPSDSKEPSSSRNSSLTLPAAANARLEQRISFDLIFAAVFLCALHGFSAIKVVVILYINYALATRLPKQQVPPATWVFNIGILFANELCQGYPFASVENFFLGWSGLVDTAGQGSWGAWLDSFGGLMPRWEILFNITVLRLISFNLDYYWSRNDRGGSPIEVCGKPVRSFHFLDVAHAHKKKQLDPSNLSERDRVSISAQPADYSFRNYLAYVLYSPLYLTGPILTFNDYIAQLRYPPPSISTSRTVLYGIRFLVALFTMEIMLHFIYAVAISKAQPAWEVYTPFQLSMLGYFNLHIIWLKLLIPWRFFRFWALLDGVDPPENMVRCMSNNYSALAFWRGWHRSFNRWIVRYIYIPLGGSGGPGADKGLRGQVRAVLNYVAVFTFVALWHDINLKLLIWGWLVILFFLPEILATYLFPKRKWRTHPEAYRLICGVGAVGNILMMMAANLVGFAVGLDGLKGLIDGIAGSYSGLVFLVGACGALFVGVQVMFEVRQQELREGINLKC
ncbi:MAG: hypothetical protein M1819_002717 [Sarea resinae]|nr:MAG: hypothetical protein M1819_002717 [Sarea resinae]